MSSIITREEVEKIARLSNIELSESEIINAQKHLEAVLTYAARVQDIAKDVDVALLKNQNIERGDIIQLCNPQPILAQAPEREGEFFVVPVIIENN
jgi:aspartyl-tRNA(Asn)/glutamyl-tRNA(Gln) amidotransferase subunit C